MAEYRVLSAHELEYKALRVAAVILDMKDVTASYEVDNTYLDYGQDWMWTTVIRTELETGDTCQVLSPRDWGLITTGRLDDIIRVCEQIMEVRSKWLNTVGR